MSKNVYVTADTKEKIEYLNSQGVSINFSEVLKEWVEKKYEETLVQKAKIK